MNKDWLETLKRLEPIAAELNRLAPMCVCCKENCRSSKPRRKLENRNLCGACWAFIKKEFII